MFRKKEKEPVVKPENDQINRKRAQPVERDAVLAVDRNRWFYVSLGLLLICLLLALQVMKANERFANNVQVAWVKMSPDGTWDIDFFDQHRGQEFFPATIDYMLAQFVERRFSRIRHSIKWDYGFALQFMDPPLAQAFVDPKQFNAPEKAVQFIGEKGPETFINVGIIDHFESNRTSFGRVEGTLYRTNVYIEEVLKSETGSVIGEPERRIVSLQWRLKTKEEIQADSKMLRINPIGLVIIKADVLTDPGARLRG